MAVHSPAAGGDLLRMVTCLAYRSVFMLRSYRMPSPAAYERGREIAQKILAQHLKNMGNIETVAVCCGD